MSEKESGKSNTFRWAVGAFIALIAAGGGMAGWGEFAKMFWGNDSNSQTSTCILRVKGNYAKAPVFKESQYQFTLGNLQKGENVQAIGKKVLSKVYRTKPNCSTTLQQGNKNLPTLKTSQSVVQTQNPNEFVVGGGSSGVSIKLNAKQVKACLEQVGPVYVVAYRGAKGVVQEQYLEPFSGDCNGLQTLPQ